MIKQIATTGAVAAWLLTVSPIASAQGHVQALADQWAQAYNRHDGMELADLYTEDARLMMHGSATIEGRNDIRDFWISDFEVGNPLTLMTVTHAVDGSDMTLVHGDYRVVDRNDGSQLGFGRFAHLWSRLAGTDWQLDRDLWNQPYEPYDPEFFDADIQVLAERWTEAYNRHDAAALAAVYAPDAQLMMHGAPTISGREAIGAFWAEDFEEDNPLTLLTVTQAVAGADMMLVHGDYEVVDRDDGERVGFGRFAHIYHDDGSGNWLLDRDLWVQRYEPVQF